MDPHRKLSSLPPEVLGLICDEVPFCSYPALQATCRELRVIVLPRLWANLKLEFPLQMERFGHAERYVKHFRTSELVLLSHPRLYGGHRDKVKGWIRIREDELIRLRKSSEKYQTEVLGYVRRLKILLGNFDQLSRSSQIGYLKDYVIPRLTKNLAFRSIDIGGRLTYYRDPGKEVWDVIKPLATKKNTEMNMELLCGVLAEDMTPRVLDGSTPGVHLKSLKFQIRKCYGDLFRGQSTADSIRFPSSLEILEFTSVSHDQPESVSALQVQTMLEPCVNLKRLLMKGYFVINGEEDWLPRSVEDLDIAFYSSLQREDIKPITAPNVKELTICRQMLPSIGNYEFPNLEYLQLWDITAQNPVPAASRLAVLRNFHLDRLMSLKVKHLDLSETFVYKAETEEPAERSFDAIFGAFQENLVSLVANTTPLDAVACGELKSLKCFVFDAAHAEIVDWKEFIKFCKTSTIEEAYMLVYDTLMPEQMPKFFERFVTKYSNQRHHRSFADLHAIEKNGIVELLRSHRTVESSILYQIDVKGTKECGYL